MCGGAARPARSNCAPRTRATTASRSGAGRPARRRRRRGSGGSASPSRLHLRQPIDALGKVLVLAGVGLQLEADGERARDLADLLERVGQLVEQLMQFIVG